LIKTILAWWTAQIQYQIWLHVGSATLDPVPRLAARLGSNSARLTRFGSARGWWRGRWVPLCWRVRWLVAEMAYQLCMLTSQLHHADVIPGMSTVHADITIMSWWHHSYPGQSHGSGQPIWAKKTCGTRGARGQTSCRRVMESAAMSDVRFWRRFHQWLRLFLLCTVVWSKHNFDNFYFWAKSNTPLNHVLWYQLLGNSDRWCFDICPLEDKHTDIIFYVVRQNRLLSRERVHIIRD